MPASRRSALRVWVPVVLSALVQLGTTFGVLATRSVRTMPPWLHHAAPRIDQPALVVIAAVVLALAGPVLLVWIRRWPGPLLVAIAACAVLGETLLITVVGAVAFYISVVFGVVIAVLQGARLWAWVVTGVLWLTPIALYLATRQVGALVLLVPWTIVSILVLVVPEGARNRRAWRAQLLRDAEARQAEEAQAERVRIARELHDVLAHSLSQINVQASVGLHLFDTQPEKAAEALANVKDTSKQALGEVRQVLGMLRGDEAPLTPEHDLAGIRQLVEDVRGAEAVLDFGVPDAAAVPAAVQQAAYRIVQEALTNVTKHARAGRIRVEVVEASGEGGWLLVAVSDDGQGAAATPSPDGRGLLGMRERTELLGGVFSAGPRPDRGFEVRAELPLRSPS
ncbi:sensor histidine kinase [Gryllotalpicola protaetiae]|nr:sensor histidine kinase [Gryllotalpicola protaetiae]